MRQELVIRSLPQAFEVIEQMALNAKKWEAGYRMACRKALVASTPSAKTPALPASKLGACSTPGPLGPMRPTPLAEDRSLNQGR